MPVAEFHSWLAFYQVEPFGDARADLRSGIVAALIARTMGGRKNASPIDYMPVVHAQHRDDEARTTQKARNAVMRQTFEGNLGGTRVRRVKVARPRRK